jgi:hypothetical protein
MAEHSNQIDADDPASHRIDVALELLAAPEMAAADTAPIAAVLTAARAAASTAEARIRSLEADLARASIALCERGATIAEARAFARARD